MFRLTIPIAGTFQFYLVCVAVVVVLLVAVAVPVPVVIVEVVVLCSSVEVFNLAFDKLIGTLIKS